MHAVSWTSVLAVGGIVFQAGVAYALILALRRASEAQQKDINGLGRAVRDDRDRAKRDHRHALVAAYRSATDPNVKDSIVEMFLHE